MKKAIKAVFQTDMLTFCTLMVLAALGTVLIYAGSSGGEGGTSQLFPFLEDQLRSPVGMAVGAFALLIIYIVLSLRFLPQAFGLKSGRAIPLMFVAVLIPHLGALYLVGQRMGWIF
jgi:hypothetical protein